MKMVTVVRMTATFQKGLFAESISQISLSRNQLAFQRQNDDKEDLAVKNDLRQTSHARRWCPITPIHLDEVKFAFFGFCPSSFQSRQKPMKASLWKAPLSFGCQLFTDGLRRRVETSCPEYLCIKRCYPRVASILIVETTLERSNRMNEMIKMKVYRRVMGNFLNCSFSLCPLGIIRLRKQYCTL